MIAHQSLGTLPTHYIHQGPTRESEAAGEVYVVRNVLQGIGFCDCGAGEAGWNGQAGADAPPGWEECLLL